jgi:hypothetical protein
VEIIQPANEKQISYLLDHFERVRDTARPESVPDLIDLTANFAGKHGEHAVVTGRRPKGKGKASER